MTTRTTTIGLLCLLGACSSTSPQTVPIIKPVASDAGTPTTSGPTQSDEAASLKPLLLKESTLAKYADDTTSLTYAFDYLDFSKSDPITFVKGVASLRLTHLPVGKTGDMKLAVKQGSVSILEGVTPGVILAKGENTIELALKPVSKSGGTASATIEIKVSSSPDDTGKETTAPDPGKDKGTASTTVTYAKDVKPILDSYCTECHSVSGGVSPDFSTFPFPSGNASAVASIIRTVQGGSMPKSPNPKMPSAKLDVIRKWKADGIK